MKTEQFLSELQQLCKKYDAEIEGYLGVFTLTIDKDHTDIELINKDGIVLSYD